MRWIWVILWLPLRLLRLALLPLTLFLCMTAFGAYLSGDILAACLVGILAGICAHARERLYFI